jgi:DNA-binding CsgD family transcriptional regulator
VHAELTPHEAIVRRCQGLAATFGLSEREGDVLVLVAEGRSSARIQEDLSIAAGTVNYHTRNIYAKLGVHSRQEVIDLVLGGGGD